MTLLHRTTRRAHVATIGATNPLPPLFSGWDIHQVEGAGDADAAMLAGARYGRVDSVLPYLNHDGYDRRRQEADLDVVVLENEHLRAEFLLGMGGRLWSLIAKDTDTELLHRNDIVQPAHFALRNAWVAGGVEWNIGTIGHTVLTAEPLHTVEVTGPGGVPALRMYEYERLRGVIYQVDAWIPTDAAVLLVHIRIINPTGDDVPMYWWSNIAVPETESTRVLTPADRAWKFDYSGVIRSVPVPGAGDITYPRHSFDAADYFFDVTASDRPWIAAIDHSGTGLAQASTDRLQGRKLFLWGHGPGGRHWQEWLSGPGRGYAEIQAGLARTQLEHIPMPGGQSWQWVEAYGQIHTDPALTQGDDWHRARAAGGDAVDDMLAGIDLEHVLAETETWIDSAPTATIEAGSGWGALRQQLRGTAEVIDRPGTPFPRSTITAEQRDWLAALDGATHWAGPPDAPPRAYQIDQQWEPILARMTGWQALLHRGILAAARGDLDRADDLWHQSLQAEENAWSWRHLARLRDHRGDPGGAAAAYRRAMHLVPGFLPLVREGLDSYLAVGDHHEVLAQVSALAPDLREHGRIRLAQARAAVATGALQLAGEVLADLQVPDLQEGDTSLSDLWADYRRAQGLPGDPIPTHLDFRMKSAAE